MLGILSEDFELFNTAVKSDEANFRGWVLLINRICDIGYQ
jgi:hypothetical protein